jgi:hypothetical protein
MVCSWREKARMAAAELLGLRLSARSEQNVEATLKAVAGDIHRQ